MGLIITLAILWSAYELGNSEFGKTPINFTTKKQRVDNEIRSRSEEIKDFFKHADTNINFFGKVIDQNGNGVAGVGIHYHVSKSGIYNESGEIKNTDERNKTLSDVAGKFEIRGAKGLTLSIGPLEKAGYRDGSKSPRSYGYKGTPELHSSDPNKPVEFVIVRDDVPKTKEIYQKRLRFAWNQGEVRIPLGNKLGDIIIVPSRMKKSEELRDFDWNVKVNMEQAELISLGEYYAPIAPDAGYQSSFEYGTSKGDDKIPGGASKTLAFKTTDGFYGIVRLSVYPDREDFGVNGSLNVRINPSGARNLD